MKIVFIGLSGYDYPFVRVRCYEFAREMGKYGIETRVLSFRDHLSDGLSEVEMWDRGDREKVKMSMKALAGLLNERGSLFYIQKIHYNAAAPLLMATLGLNRYVLDYDDWDEGIECLFARPWLNALFFGRYRYPDILKVAAERAGACVVSSTYLKDRLAGYKPRIALIPTGVDTKKFEPRPGVRDSDKVIFGWNGVVWGDLILRNAVFMLDCFKKVALKNKQVALRIAGGGQLMPAFRKIVSTACGGLDIEICDWMPHERMPGFLSGIDIGLLPLIQKGNPWIESKSPTKLFEYMAMGLPTVATRAGEAKNIVADGYDGFLADGMDEYTEKMLALASDAALRKTMGARAREKTVEKHSISALGKQLSDFMIGAGLI